MVAYLVRRLLYALSTLLVVSFGAFVAFGLSLDPTYPLILGGRDNPRRVALQEQFHLTDPILVRYWLWLKGLFRHGFGDTVMAGAGGIRGSSRAIDPVILSALSSTAQLLAVGLALTVLLSVLIGTVSARRPGRPVDVTFRLLGYVAWSVPTFVAGVLLARWLGPTGWFYGGPPHGGVLRWLRTITLPAVALALGLIGLYSRYVRSAMLVSLGQPYTTVARAKGLPERQVLLRHALRTSLVPLVTVLSLDLGAVVGATLAADWVFQTGGLASLFVFAIGAADPFELTALVVVLAGIVVVFTFLGDLAIGWLDPRARSGAIE